MSVPTACAPAPAVAHLSAAQSHCMDHHPPPPPPPPPSPFPYLPIPDTPLKS
ncbi:hypothetical protein K440DRAFT_625591 [Wilcoxina mikolae CBS 423.85]|nr:hypothetical protein K440DRAFT_625591 [Wilcoxina mikolae CBS 423.85]